MWKFSKGQKINDPEVIQRIQESMDVLILQGEGTDWDLLQEAV